MEKTLLVIGISDFGSKIVDLLSDHNERLRTDYKYSESEFFNESEIAFEKINTLKDVDEIENYSGHLVLFIADGEEESLKTIKRLNSKIEKELSVGIIEKKIFTSSLDSVVFARNSAEAFEIVKLFHDFLLVPTLIGVDFEDVKSLCTGKFLQCGIAYVDDNSSFEEPLLDYSNKEILKNSNMAIMGIYGDKNLGMHLVAQCAKNIDQTIKDGCKFIFNAFLHEPELKDQRKVVVLFDNSDDKIDLKNKISENPHLFPEATSKRGVFVLAAELPSGGYTYISIWRKSHFGEDEGYHLLMFNELLLANSYVHMFREQLATEKVGADFATDFIFMKQIVNQEDWDNVLGYLLSDNIKKRLINPCLEEKTKDHNCIVRPISLEKHLDFNELSTLFETLPNTHVVMKGENEDEIINVTVLE